MFQIQNVHLPFQKLARKRTNPPPQVMLCTTPIYTVSRPRSYITFPTTLLTTEKDGGRGKYVKDECNLRALLIGKATITSHVFILQANKWAFILYLAATGILA
jgi:hypothetical protein